MPESATDNVDGQVPRFLARLRETLAMIATLMTLLIMLGGHDWRGGPPPAVDFIVLITIAAFGCGLGYGSYRDPRSRRYLGLFCLAVCGLFLARGLIGLLQGSLRGFAW